MKKETIKAICIIGAFYVLLECLGITCPIRFVTGISCAGCGMSRAWLSLLRLDFQAAFSYHPLFLLPPAAVVLVLLSKRIPKKLYQIAMAVMVILFLLVYLIRMLDPGDTVVTFDPGAGLIPRIIAGIREL